MSRHHQQFLAELDAEWPAKKEGFTLRGMQKLRGAERDGARELLRAAVVRGDTTAVDALAVLDGPDGLAFLRAQLHPAADQSVQTRIVTHLLSLGPNPTLEPAVVALLSARYSTPRGEAIRALGHFPPTDRHLAMLVQNLRTDPPNRLPAASVLLRKLGRAPGDNGMPEFRSALAALRLQDDAAREDMLRQLSVGGGS